MKRYGWDIVQFERMLIKKPGEMAFLLIWIEEEARFEYEQMQRKTGQKKAPRGKKEWDNMSVAEKADWRDTTAQRSKQNNAATNAALTDKFGAGFGQF